MSAAQRQTLADTILTSAGDAILCCDRDGLIRFWNPGAVRIFGFSAEQALGQSLDIIIPEQQRARHWHGFQRVIESGHTHYGEGDLLAVPALRQDGRRISVEFTIMPMHGPGGRMDGMAAVMRDVTEHFEALRDARRRLKDAQKAEYACCPPPEQARRTEAMQGPGPTGPMSDGHFAG